MLWIFQMNESRFISRFNLDLNSSQPFRPHYFSQVYIKHNMCLCTCLQAKPIRLCKCVCSSKGPEVQALALFINTSVELTVHSRGGLQGKELGHSPHKKSLLIYFPSNWKVHAHTWLNHHASTEDGPPPHTGETWAQLCCTVLGQPGMKKHTNAQRTL